MRKFGTTNPHGTAFAPKQWLYEKESTGMESSQCITPIRGKTPHTCAGLQTNLFHGRQYRAENGNMRNLGVYQSPWYRVCTKSMVI